jgi:3-oxoacyl-[acyl-carrier-protein] synthase-1
MDKVVVTGAGVVSAIGVGKAATLDALLNMRSGVAPVRYLTTAHREMLVGEVKYSDAELREMSGINASEAYIRSSLLAIPAVKEAMEQAKLTGGGRGTFSDSIAGSNTIAGSSGLRIGFISGITVGGMDKAELKYLDFLDNDRENAYIALNDCGACTEQIADYFNCFCYTTTIATACSSSANALMLGADMLKSGRLDVVVAGGAECLSRYHVNGFKTLMILSEGICKPFDANRSGINLGEGAGYLVLETGRGAAKRGVRPIGVISGYCNACDAYHPTASSPNGYGPFLAMRGAVENAGLRPDEINYINAHGTGTPNNDLTEGLAAMQLFGDRMPPIASIKAFTGHTTSAAGSFEAVVSLLALEHQFVPVNLNFRDRIEEHNFTPVVDPSPRGWLRHILSNSFGFGGNDSAIVISAI